MAPLARKFVNLRGGTPCPAPRRAAPDLKKSDLNMNISDNLYYVGVNDRVKHRFEALWSLPCGVSYNSYLITGGRTVLVDTVDVAFFAEYLEKINAVLAGRPLDYLVINHMEPDHSGSIALVRKYFPGVRLVGNSRTMEMVRGYYGEATGDDLVVKDGDTLDLGDRTLTFYLAPMLHWPETMVTYDAAAGILFSGDAFGCFGALNGAVLDTQMDTAPYLPEMERYCAAILGKFRAPVRAALAKLAGLEINMICSTHGPVWTEEVPRVTDLYRRFAEGTTEPGLVVCYGSMYGHTQRMAEAVAEGAARAGLRKVVVHNLSVSPLSAVLTDVFRYGALAVGAPTYNGGLFPPVEDLMQRLAHRDVSCRHLGFFGGFCWSQQATKVMEEYARRMKITPLTASVVWKQGVGREQLEQARLLGRRLAEGLV